ncbi:MAG: MerR family transcriptional regulator [Acidobacteriota bacterium]|nr:MerR family transcriptional regulator [Acidobacteriota bacterium]
MSLTDKKLFYKIGEVCKTCGIEPHVLRYWESEFNALSPTKTRSGHRIYREKDVQLVQTIKKLLYEEGYTVAGANKHLLEGGSSDLPLFQQGLGIDQTKMLAAIQKELKAILSILENNTE